jgi:hypothetical protein
VLPGLERCAERLNFAAYSPDAESGTGSDARNGETEQQACPRAGQTEVTGKCRNRLACHHPVESFHRREQLRRASPRTPPR